jgi:tetratricopeptide (TPR) repeat protein
MTARAFVLIAAGSLLTAGCSQPEEESSLALGKRLFDQGKWDASIAVLDETIASNPLEEEAYLYRGRAYHCKGREYLSQAIRDFNEAIRINPNFYEAYYSRAVAYKEKGDRQRALADSMTARRLDPSAESATRLQSPSTEEYERVLRRVTAAESELPSIEKQPKSAFDNATDDLGAPDELAAPPDATAKTKSKGSSSRRDGEAADLRDTYGLPLSSDHSKSITEQIFGAGRKEFRDVGGNARTVTSGRGRMVRDWQFDSPPATPLTSEAPSTNNTATRQSPVGTLPFGNPYQPGGSYYSPYSPLPRSTGLRGDPTVRAYQLPPYYQQSPYYQQPPYYDRRTATSPYQPLTPGVQPPLYPTP